MVCTSAASARPTKRDGAGVAGDGSPVMTSVSPDCTHFALLSDPPPKAGAEILRLAREKLSATGNFDASNTLQEVLSNGTEDAE